MTIRWRFHVLIFASVLGSQLATPPGGAAFAQAVPKPPTFLANQGQWSTSARFVARRGSLIAYFDESSIRLVSQRGRDHGCNDRAVVRLSFEHRSPRAVFEGEARAPGVYNFLVGRDRSRWRRRVPHYESLLCRDLYEGIDLRVRPAEQDPNLIEYDLIVAPGADLGQIEVACEGIEGLHVTAQGELVLESKLGPITQSAPVAWYETLEGERRAARCRFRLRGPRSFGFESPNPDPSLRLVIDPVLEMAAHFGGFGTDLATVVRRTTTGSTLLAGESDSFPDVAAVADFVAGIGGGTDSFLVRLSPKGELEYWTYFGGGSGDTAESMVMTESGVALAGHTRSDDFPTTNDAFDESLGGVEDAFVTILDESGELLLYSTLLGGSEGDLAMNHCLAADDAGLLYVAGSTNSRDFPTTAGVFGPTFLGGRDAFLTILDPNAPEEDQLVYSTYVGGAGDDAPGPNDVGAGVPTQMGLALDRDGTVYIGGRTTSRFGEVHGPGGGWDAFVVAIAPDPGLAPDEQLFYAARLGGGDLDTVYALTPHPRGGVMALGSTFSGDFPATAEAYQPRHANPGQADLFLTQVIPNADELPYSTFFGGASGEIAYDLAFDERGAVTFCGRTVSADFPHTPDGVEFPRARQEAFLVQLDPDPALARENQIVYSTCYGGTGDDVFFGLDVEPSGRVTAAGMSSSQDAPREGNPFEFGFGRNSILVARFGLERFIRGDCNGDAAVNIADALCALDWLFAGGRVPGCLAAVNSNGDDKVDIADPVSLLNFLFVGGPEINEPYPDCGPGMLPADKELGCLNPPDC